MTYEVYLKTTWKQMIDKLTVGEIYDLLSSGSIQLDGGICNLCQLFFEPCPDTLSSDEICKSRFTLICQKEIFKC